MFGAFTSFGKLGSLARAIAAAWSPLSLWPDGISSPGMWISPRTLTSQWQDYTGTTPVTTPGTVADTSNPVGLALDIRAGATVLTDPGNHMLQSTSVSRPLLSARVNWFLSPENLLGAAWGVASGASKIDATTFAPTTQYGLIIQGLSGKTPGETYTFSVDVAAISGNTSLWLHREGATTSQTPITVTSTPQRFSITGVVDAGGFLTFGVQDRNASGQGVVYVSVAQANTGSTALPYQRITTASNYDGSAGPTYLKYDGVDDGMATAAFSAGTLIAGMDCMIAVRRDSAAATYLISDTGSRGFFEWESGDTNRPDVSAGTPTYYVDGAAVTATRGALFTALTAGDWHILEARGLDLSTWTKVEVSSLVSYRLNGPRGDIFLYPSTASTEDKDAARQYLADYYGVTLP